MNAGLMRKLCLTRDLNDVLPVVSTSEINIRGLHRGLLLYRRCYYESQSP